MESICTSSQIARLRQDQLRLKTRERDYYYRFTHLFRAIEESQLIKNYEYISGDGVHFHSVYVAFNYDE